jgi:hypothetical protein
MNDYQMYPNNMNQLTFNPNQQGYNDFTPYQPPQMGIPNYNNQNNTFLNNTMPNSYNHNADMMPMQTGDFNNNMNHLVRSTHKDRGVVMKENGGATPYNNNFQNNQNVERKKQLLSNIQQQMTLSKSSKLQELERKRKEDEKYLNEMNNFYPFGR